MHIRKITPCSLTFRDHARDRLLDAEATSRIVRPSID
jgi:hypothetical protein